MCFFLGDHDPGQGLLRCNGSIDDDEVVELVSETEQRRLGRSNESILACESFPISNCNPTKRDVWRELGLPSLDMCSAFQLLNTDESDDLRCGRLERCKQFMFELCEGMDLFFLDPSGGRCIVHTTLMDKLDVISLDQGDGRIVEFPLMPVTSARQAVLHAGKFYYVDSERQKHMPSGIDHVVVIMLIRHKLVFLFDSFQDAESFLMCLEVLLWRLKRETVIEHETYEFTGTDECWSTWTPLCDSGGLQNAPRESSVDGYQRVHV